MTSPSYFDFKYEKIESFSSKTALCHIKEGTSEQKTQSDAHPDIFCRFLARPLIYAFRVPGQLSSPRQKYQNLEYS